MSKLKKIKIKPKDTPEHIREMLGLKEDIIVYPPLKNTVDEYVWVNDRLFHRNKGNKFFYLANNIDGINPKDDTNRFQIMCECGSHKFKLTYGDYALDAHCCECGNIESVYEG
jgi:hypothetical protein